MHHDAVAALRHALLLSLGLAACSSRPPGESGVDGVDPAPGPIAAPAPKPAPAATGYVRDEDSTVHRAGAQQCAPDNPRPACTDPGRSAQCTSDAQCTDGAYGRCTQGHGQVGAFCSCDYSCASDSDCKTGELCVCGDALGGEHHATCVPATCKADSECAGGVCGLSVYHNGCGEALALACRGEGDTCKRQVDCPEGQVCAVDGETRKWTCQGVTCAIGRPLLVDGVSRTAATVASDAWTDALELPALAAADAARLAAHWAEIAALEHASVASFARFTLELMALGAPAELLADAQRAALDEIDHARLAWSLAGLWSGARLGPGPLATADLGARSLAAFVAALVHEGCIGETLGAAEAGLLAELADPRLAPRLARVAADETRHAALAWRTLAWLHGRFGLPVAQAARSAAASFAAQQDRGAVDATPGPLHAWGIPGPALLLARRRAAYTDVVEPLLAATLTAAPHDRFAA